MALQTKCHERLTPTSQEGENHCSLNRLLIQHGISIFQCLNFLLSRSNAFLAADLDLDALRLQLVKVSVGFGKLLIDTLQHFLSVGFVEFCLILLELGLHFQLVLGDFVRLGIP